MNTTLHQPPVSRYAPPAPVTDAPAILYAWHVAGQSSAPPCEQQLALCRAFARRRGFRIVAEFRDTEPATYFEDARPVLWQAIESLKPDGVLVVSRFDRLASLMCVSDMVEQAAWERRATILSASGEPDWPDPPDQRPWREFLRERAAWERSVRGNRMHYARQARQSRVPPPYGYRRDPHAPACLHPHPGEQAAVARIVQLRAAGHGYREIARTLDAERVPCRGQRWNHTVIKRILARAQRANRGRGPGTLLSAAS